MGQWSIHFYQGGEKFRVSEQEDVFEIKTIIYGFHNWQLCSLTFFFCSIWKTVKRRKYFNKVKSSKKRERIVFAFYRITEASQSR